MKPPVETSIEYLFLQTGEDIRAVCLPEANVNKKPTCNYLQLVKKERKSDGTIDF